MGQPATAAIVVALIFAVPAALYVSWKGYAKFQRYKQAQSAAHELPPIRDPIAAPTHGSVSANYASSPATTPYGTWKASSSKGSIGAATSLGPGSVIMSDGLGGKTWRYSAQGLMATPTFGADSTSAPASPLSLGADATMPSSSEPHHHYEHSRGISSSSSTMAIKRSYASSNRSGATSPIPFEGQKRSSYLPHLPENRDSIQIIPPQPLGIGFGGMATATDQRTLAFSRQSGIGSDSDWSAGLAWAEQQDANAARNHMEEARSRYLAEGPSSKLSASPVGSHRSGSGVGAGGGGGLSPGGGSSRSVSSRRSQLSEYRDPNAPYSSPPSAGARKGSASSVQNGRRPLLKSSSHGSGTSIDDQPPSPNRYEDALQGSGPSTPPSAYIPPQAAQGAQLNSQHFSSQSPLQGLSSQWSGSTADAKSASKQGSSPLSAPARERTTRNRPDTAGLTDDSPILSAFRVGGDGGGHGGQTGGSGTPALASRAASGSGSGSASSATGPATDSSGRPSASGDADAPPDLEAGHSATEKEAPRANGWGLSGLLGMATS